MTAAQASSLPMRKELFTVNTLVHWSVTLTCYFFGIRSCQGETWQPGEVEGSPGQDLMERLYLHPGAQILEHGSLASNHRIWDKFFCLKFIGIKSFPLKSKYLEKRLVDYKEVFASLKCMLSTMSGLRPTLLNPEVF